MSALPAGQAGLADWVAPSRSALLLIDIQDDFASPSGILGGFGVDLSAVPAAIDASARLATAARRAGVPVIFIGLSTSAETDSTAWKERMRRLGDDPDAGMDLCRAGTQGAAFYGIAPEPGDAVVLKTRYSGFVGTDLDARLKALGADTLIVCGLTTECCVDCTARDAFHLDYHVILAADACAAYGDDIHAAACKNLALNCVIPVRADDVASAWTGWTPRNG